MGTMEDCDVFISVLYEKLVSEDFIASKWKCFNFHPGILPQYRGSGAFSWAILNGDHHFGITLHEIDVSIDHGRIISTRTEPIPYNSTAEYLFARGEEIIIDEFKRMFHVLLLGNYGSVEQDETAAKMYYRRDLERAKDLTRYVRAFTFKGKENAYYYDHTGKKHYLVY